MIWPLVSSLISVVQQANFEIIQVEYADSMGILASLVIKLFGYKNKFKIGISLFPVSTEQLKDIADANQVMPPKSTWIEPKLRSGLTIMDLDDTNAY